MTKVEPLSGYSGLTIVSFSEVWPGACRPNRLHNVACLIHTWQITESASAKPVGTRTIGDIAPQLYR